MNNISNQLEQLIQKQKKTYKEMTDLINQSCKNNDLSLVGKILEEYELKLETIQKEVHEIT